MSAELSVVVPVYANAGSLTELIERLDRVCAECVHGDAEFIFVDDRSPDDSFLMLERHARRDPRIAALRLSRNFGSNAAILAGLSHARGRAVCVLSADLQDPPELISRMVDHWKAGADVVMAARSGRGDPLPSRLTAAVFNRLFRSLVLRDFPRDGYDFVLLDRRVVASLVAMPEKNSFLFGQILWLGYNRVVLPYRREERRGGRSSWTFWRKVKYFVDAFTAFSYLPLRAASAVGIALAALGFAYAAYVFWERLAGDIPVPGFSALMVVLLVASGTQLVVIGLTGEYLWRVLEEVRPRPLYVVDRAVNLAPDTAHAHRSRDAAARTAHPT